MNEENMKKHLKETFESEVPEVLHKIKASPQFRIPEKQNGFNLKNILNRRFSLSMMSVFLVVLLAFVFVNRQSTVVASTVTLEVNPSIVITLNDDDFVVSVTALSDDGREVVQRNIRYRGLTLEACIEILVERLNELGYVVTSSDENNILLIEVDTERDDIRDRIEKKLEEKLQNELARYSDSHWVLNSREIKETLTPEQKRLLLESELMEKYTLAKLSLIYRIHELDQAYLLRELANMPLRELYDLYIQLEDVENLPEFDKMPPPRPRGHNFIPFNGFEQVTFS